MQANYSTLDWHPIPARRPAGAHLHPARPPQPESAAQHQQHPRRHPQEEQQQHITAEATLLRCCASDSSGAELAGAVCVGSARMADRWVKCTTRWRASYVQSGNEGAERRPLRRMWSRRRCQAESKRESTKERAGCTLTSNVSGIMRHVGAGRAKNWLHFSICACHPCAGAMLIFSVSFQF